MLAHGVAIASPWVVPQGAQWVCSSAGGVKTAPSADDGSSSGTRRAWDCPLCIDVGTPPVAVPMVVEAVDTMVGTLQSMPAADVSALAAAPLPARGPPVVCT